MSWLRVATAFCSACLLFVVQPLLAKWLLPGFGGSPSTWAACMVFFQGMLLAGYAYAHLLVRFAQRRPRAAFAVHALFVVCACVLLWRAPVLAELPLAALPPALRIAWLLWGQAGAPYLLLASSAPLLQHWAALAHDRAPHWLYAVSNAGSLLALLAYPIAIEGAWPIARQFSLWSAGCLLLAAASLASALAWLQNAAPAVTPAAPAAPVAARSIAAWLCCAFVPGVLLLAVTTHITVDIAATPLLWVVPLALYLLSFIVAFAGLAAWARPLFVLLWIACSLGVAYNGFAQGSASLWVQLGFSLLGLFSAGVLCHDVLVRTRPVVERLTSFYLYIACGGALSGVFVSWLAPLLFRDYYELELATLATYVVLLVRWGTPATLAAPSRERPWLWLGLGVCLPLIAAVLVVRSADEGRTGRVLERRRSFLGALRVTEFKTVRQRTGQIDAGRMLTHGRIRHGMQLSAAGRELWPTMYFGPGTALARVLADPAATAPRRIGVIGLGVGTIAAYAHAADVVRFYELDPNVLELAQRYFSFLRDSPGRREFALGDGRFLLAHEPARGFDVLVLDAFASDSVPVHLLTTEAFDVYLRHLAPNGVLLANVTNRHLAVDRVVRAAARAHGLTCTVFMTEKDEALYVSKVRWAVLARDPARLSALLQGMEPAAISGPDVLWTDARASLWLLR